MSAEDRGYFEARAEQELSMAQAATHPKAARVHHELAGFYLEIAHNGRETAPRLIAAG